MLRDNFVTSNNCISHKTVQNTSLKLKPVLAGDNRERKQNKASVDRNVTRKTVLRNILGTISNLQKERSKLF